MKKKNLLILAISLILALALGKYLMPLFTKGTTVRYQRATGPELRVIKGEEHINKLLKHKNITHSELFVLDNLDTKDGPLLNSDQSYIVQMEIKGFKPIDSGSENLYPLIKINKILTNSEYYIICGLFFLFSSAFLIGVVRLQSSN